MKEELTAVIKELREISTELSLNWSNDVIGDLAVRIYLSREISKEQSKRYANKQASYEKKDSANEPATEAQKNWLIKNSYEGDVSKLSKMEASKLIDEAIKRSKGIQNEDY
jgi:hypothetical protein